MICYVTNKICYNTKNFISNEIENILIELLISKTKAITVGVMYKPGQCVKRRTTYTRGSEYKLISEWFSIRGTK